MKYLNNKVQLGVFLSNKIHDQTDPVNLRPDHVLGVFAAWLVGILIATIVLMIEILTKHFQNNRIQKSSNFSCETVLDLELPGFNGTD